MTPQPRTLWSSSPQSIMDLLIPSSNKNPRPPGQLYTSHVTWPLWLSRNTGPIGCQLSSPLPSINPPLAFAERRSCPPGSYQGSRLTSWRRVRPWRPPGNSERICRKVVALSLSVLMALVNKEKTSTPLTSISPWALAGRGGRLWRNHTIVQTWNEL